jgi:hypothetical protein
MTILHTQNVKKYCGFLVVRVPMTLSNNKTTAFESF